MQNSFSISSRLLRGWLWLVGLSAVAAVLTAGASGTLTPAHSVVGAAVLILALAKARVILSSYLGLAGAPRWLAGFMWAVGFWGLLALTLYLAPFVFV